MFWRSNLFLMCFLSILSSCGKDCGNSTGELFKKSCSEKSAEVINPPEPNDEDDSLGVDTNWTSLPSLNSPAARKLHSVVMVGAKMCVWGGHNASFLNTGACLDLESMIWTEITPTGAPSARVFHGAVGTESLMCVWGGWNNSVALADGGCYNPGTNTWFSMNATGAPGASLDVTAVWTGSEMCLFGGSAQHCFNPDTNSWRPMSVVNMAANRTSNAIAWTGVEMCVWGGNTTLGNKSNTGGCYNPNSDSWIQLPTSGAPVGRERVTGTWVNGHFCVFGGRTTDAPTMVNNGGCFNRETQTWHSTQEIALSGREHVVAISNGIEMCVWGGQNASERFNDGSCYNPVTQTWRLNISDSQTPSRRVSHAGAWFNKSFCIWGGSDTGFLGDGGCLNFE
jgi:hypothetical protein